MSLRDCVAVVTGAASGIGRALCPLLGREGVRVGLLDCNPEGLSSLEAELHTEKIPCAKATADVRDRQGVQQAFEGLTKQLGPVDLLVACAGITGETLIPDLEVEKTERILQVNLLGVAHAINAVLPSMIARQSGQIVAISSLAGCRGMPFSAGYSASKAGLAAYLESLRPALRRRGIYVTTVLPGFVRTPLMETARVQPPVAMMEPEVAAAYVMKAIQGRRRVYSFPFSTSLVVRFLNWMPAGIFDWMMARGAAKVPNVQY